MAYDKNNIFAKILRGEIPCNKIYENEHTFAFHDVNPQTPIHALVIPKGEYISMIDFSENASETEISSLFKTVTKVARELGVENNGYRILSNIGDDANQEVKHLHIHIFGGCNVGAMICRR